MPRFFYLLSSSFITESFTFVITLFQSGGVVWVLGLFFLDSEGDYFDRLLTVKMSLHQYLLSHYKFHILLILSSYILALPFGFFREHVWLYLTVGVIWNSGWLSFVIFILAPFFPKYLDIRGKSSFNMQGMGVRYWIIFFPALFAVNFLGRIKVEVIPTWLLITMAGSGILMVLVSSLWISGIAKILSRRKYKIAAVYRER